MGWKIGELFHGIRKKNEPAVRPEVIIRLQQIRDLYLESADIMANTRNLTTFLYRYEDARRFISGFNSIMVQEGQAPIPEMNDDIDALFSNRIREVVTYEIESAQKLKTPSGRQNRLQRIISALESVDRKDGGFIDDVIIDVEDSVFRAMYQGVDWSKEPSDYDLGVDEGMVLQAMKEAAIRDARRRGFDDTQIEAVVKKVFGK